MFRVRPGGSSLIKKEEASFKDLIMQIRSTAPF